MKDGICAPSLKSEPLIFVITLLCHISRCAAGVLLTVYFMIIRTEVAFFKRRYVLQFEHQYIFVKLIVIHLFTSLVNK